MKDEARKHFIDILQAAEELQDFVRGMDFEAYRNRRALQVQYLNTISNQCQERETRIGVFR